jgi:hypothetical protein
VKATVQTPRAPSAPERCGPLMVEGKTGTKADHQARLFMAEYLLSLPVDIDPQINTSD